MFSGIIETQGKIISTEDAGKCRRVRIQKPRSWKLALGESVSVDGICSTVVAKTASSFDVEYMPQTLRHTTAAQFQSKRMVNLERSLRYGDRIHGHFVAGHIDTRANIQGVKKRGRSRLVLVSLPRELSKFVVARGSVAINGVSLTVAKKTHGFFAVALIPHTLAKTNLGDVQRGDDVNIEADMLARYRGSGTVSTHAKKKTRR